jgi:hypothetical protein
VHVVVIHGWKAETTELVQAISGILGILVSEVRQRIIGGGPAVMASFADPQQARALSEKLNQNGIATMVVDAAEIGLLLAATSIVAYSETKKVTERKFSLGKTILAGGIPMSKKVEHQQRVTIEERGKVLYLYAGDWPLIVFSQDGMIYDGLGAAMKLTRELNFTYVINELRRLCPGAIYDDRLLKRVGQVRLLGPALSPETHLDLAVEILARSLRPSPKRNNAFVQ